MAAAALMVGSLGFPASGALALSTTVTCDGTDDIADVQAAVDAAPSGVDYVIELSGTCDFSAAPAHGGTVASIGVAAVVIRPPSLGSVTDLTITSAGPARSATVKGAGEETAFAILPGNDQITISGLRFEALARPVVVLGAQGAVIGGPGGLLASNGNRFDGDLRTNSSVLAVADDRPMTLNYGAADNLTAVTVTPATLTDLTVQGNSVVYLPPGPAGPEGFADVVAIDVRQAAGGTVESVTISDNAVAMFADELGSFRHNAVRVEGLAAIAAPTPPSPTDFRIRDVRVANNNFGRFEDLESPEALGIDPSETHAAGRAGVVLIRVGDFDVSANEVRARLSTAGGLGAPGGGIVVSDSAFGQVADNDAIVVFGDPTVPESSDLGAVAVVDGLPTLFGSSAADQPTFDIEVRGNVLGSVAGASVGARRGVVLSGSSRVRVWENEIHSTAKGIYFGAAVQRGTVSLTTRVTSSVACGNTLDGTADDPAEVSFAGHTSSRGNAFPGGSGAGANGGCTPTLAVSPTSVGSGADLTATGRAWGGAEVEVVLTDEYGATASGTGMANATGTDAGLYTVTIPSGDMTGLADGWIVAVATARESSGLARVSTSATNRRNAQVDPPASGTVTVNDGDGFANGDEVVTEAVTATWSPPSGESLEAAKIWWSYVPGAGPEVIPSGCGPFTVPLQGVAKFRRGCGLALPEGEFRFTAVWYGSDGEESLPAVDTSTKDTQVTTPTVSTPQNGAEFATADVLFSGSGDIDGTVHVGRRQPDGSFVTVTSVAVQNDGTWNVTASFADGSHTLSAFTRDHAGNTSPWSGVFTIHVDTSGPGPGPDTTPPAAPIITSPTAGPLYGASVPMRGTAEPGSTVKIQVDGALAGSTIADGSGNWARRMTFTTSGLKALTASATDAAGNVSATTGPVTIEVDAIAPGIAFTTPENKVFGPTDDLEVRGIANDGHEVAKVTVQWLRLGMVVATDEAVCTPGCPHSTAPVEVTWVASRDLDPGVYGVKATAVDAVGNVRETQQRFITVK